MTMHAPRREAVRTEQFAIIERAEREDRELTAAEVQRLGDLRAERQVLEALIETSTTSLPAAAPRPAPRRGIGGLTHRLQASVGLDRRLNTAAMPSSSVILGGYGALFNAVTRRPNKGARAFFLPNAFRLDGGEKRLLDGHDARRPLASTANGGLRFWQDSIGLAMEAALDGTHRATRDILVAISARDRCGLSVGIDVARSRYVTVAGERIEVIEQCSIRECSVVLGPAVVGASCWLADGSAANLDAHTLGLRKSWQAGRPR